MHISVHQHSDNEYHYSTSGFMNADIQHSFYAASDKYKYFTGKLVRGNCSGSLSIQLLAGFVGI